MKLWLTARELAEANLPELPKSRNHISQQIISVANEEHIRLVKSKNGRPLKLVDTSVLPEPARAELARRARKATDEQALIASGKELAHRQKEYFRKEVLTYRSREVAAARLTILQEIDRIAIYYSSGRTAAVAMFLKSYSSGALTNEIKAAARIANDRGRGLSRATLFRWLSKRQESATALVPKISGHLPIRPSWLDNFLPFWQRPQKPGLAEAHRQFVAQWQGPGPAPSYAEVRKAVKKLEHLERDKGRFGKLALRASQAYVTRDTSDLLPCDVYVADGTTFDAEVAHPIHGKPFKPEITTIEDVATRRIVGWSAGLSETAQGVADALRRAAQIGIPAIFYTDRGSGYVNDRLGNDLTGVLARLGTTAKTALPYHSWSKGNVERLQKHWIPLAKIYPTYLGAGMDKEAAQAVHKRTRRDIALFGQSKLLPEWPEFVAAVEAYINDYNNRPHRSLPWVRDELGRKRHMSPNQLWDSKVAAGCEIIPAEPSELVDLFYPAEIRAARRCIVWRGTNRYFSNDLDRYHGQDVFVLFDVFDASKVWCREVELVNGERKPGRLICEAQFEGNKTRYYPVSELQIASEKRAKGRLRRLQRKVDDAEAELRPSIMFEAQPVPVAANPYFPDQPAASLAGDAAAPSSPWRGGLEAASAPDPVQRDSADVANFTAPPRQGPAFADDEDFAAWCLANPTQVSDMQREAIRDMLESPTTVDELRRHGLDCVALDRLTKQRTRHTEAV